MMGGLGRSWSGEKWGLKGGETAGWRGGDKGSGEKEEWEIKFGEVTGEFWGGVRTSKGQGGDVFGGGEQ